jgi:hypothetical protein
MTKEFYPCGQYLLGRKQTSRQQLYCQKRGLTLLASAINFANHIRLLGLLDSIERQMLFSAKQNKSASVSADRTQNIPPSAILSR